LYRLRRNLLISEKGRATDSTVLQIEMPANVQLQGAKLAQVSLEGAILESAQLEGADLRQCIAAGANFNNSCLRAVIASKADLHNASLQNVDATDANFIEINLQGADICKCNFTQADLSRSVLTAKNFADAIFQSSILASATLPVGSEWVIAGSATAGQLNSDEWKREKTLRAVFAVVRKHVRISGAWFDAEDIASEVLVYLLSRPGEIARLSELPEADLRSYVLALARQLMVSFRVSEFDETHLDDDIITEDVEVISARYQETLDAEEAFEELGSLIAPPQNNEDVSALVEGLTGFLAPEALELLIARYVEESSVEEIAQRKGLSEVQVARQLNKARELARRTLRSLKKPMTGDQFNG
jgi:RNA polymerase sigma factor (sigma-70 family)